MESIPNKLINDDGTYQTLSGTIISGSQANSGVLKYMKAIPNKVINPDGSIQKLTDFLGGDGAPKTPVRYYYEEEENFTDLAVTETTPQEVIVRLRNEGIQEIDNLKYRVEFDRSAGKNFAGKFFVEVTQNGILLGTIKSESIENDDFEDIVFTSIQKFETDTALPINFKFSFTGTGIVNIIKLTLAVRGVWKLI